MINKRGNISDEFPKLGVAILILILVASSIFVFKDSSIVAFFKDLPGKIGISAPSNFGEGNQVVSEDDVRIRYSISEDKMYIFDKVKWVELKNVNVEGKYYDSDNLISIFRTYWFIGRDKKPIVNFGGKDFSSNIVRFDHLPFLLGDAQFKGVVEFVIRKDTNIFAYALPADDGNVYLFSEGKYNTRITNEQERASYQDMINAVKNWKVAKLSEPIEIPILNSESAYFCPDKGLYEQSKTITINLNKRVEAGEKCI